MHLHILKSKIHRARVTDAHFDYEGSLGIDRALMDKVGLLPYEKILVANITRGTRFETYAIPLPKQSAAVVPNGAAAHLGAVGDAIVLMAFASISPKELPAWQPKTVVLDARNQIVKENLNVPIQK